MSPATQRRVAASQTFGHMSAKISGSRANTRPEPTFTSTPTRSKGFSHARPRSRPFLASAQSHATWVYVIELI